MKPSSTTTTTTTATIRERVQRIKTMPAIPAVFLPLLKLLARDEVEVEEVVRLVSYDSAIAAQCLRVASSPLFAMSQPPKSIKGAVMSLGLRRVETIILTCCLGQAFPAKKWVLDPVVFWRFAGVRDGVPENRRETGRRRSGEGLHRRPDARHRVHGELHGFLQGIRPRDETRLRGGPSTPPSGTGHPGVHALRDRARPGGKMGTGRRHRRGDQSPSCHREQPKSAAPGGPSALERSSVPHAGHGLRIL